MEKLKASIDFHSFQTVKARLRAEATYHFRIIILQINFDGDLRCFLRLFLFCNGKMAEVSSFIYYKLQIKNLIDDIFIHGAMCKLYQSSGKFYFSGVFWTSIRSIQLHWHWSYSTTLPEDQAYILPEVRPSVLSRRVWLVLLLSYFFIV